VQPWPTQPAFTTGNPEETYFIWQGKGIIKSFRGIHPVNLLKVNSFFIPKESSIINL